MIVSFKHQRLEQFFESGATRGIQEKHAKRIRMILGRLSVSTSPRDMNLPGLLLHKLPGDRKVLGQSEYLETGELRLPLRVLMLAISIWRIPLMKMHDPPYPGEVLKELCIEPLN